MKSLAMTEDKGKDSITPDEMESHNKANAEDDLIFTTKKYFKKKKKERKKAELRELRLLSETDILCGVTPFCTPSWIQVLACKEVYFILYCMMGFVIGMFFSYSVAVMTTFEKRFKISSKQSGIILAGNDVSQVLLSVIASYYINYGHRPRWLGVGMLSASLACFLAAFPHFLYGPGDDADDLVSHSKDFQSNTSSSANITKGAQELCDSTTLTSSCEQDDSSYNSYSKESLGPVILSFLCQFFIGIMTSIYGSVGYVYLDDNSDKRNSSIYIAVSSVLKLIGPLSGSVLGSSCLALWIDPSKHPSLSQKDPRWMGAWWIGYLIMSLLQLMIGALMFFFPRKLPETLLKEVKDLRDKYKDDQQQTVEYYVNQLNTNKQDKKPSLQKLPIALRRLFTNKIWLGNLFSSVLCFLAISGISSFVPKYCETQFRRSASEANLYIGIVGLVSTLLGLIISSLLMKIIKPGPRAVTGYILFLVLFVGVSICFMTSSIFRCPKLNLVGLDKQLNSSCWSDCGCTNRYEPVCGEDNVTLYYSGCYAGCSQVNDNYNPLRYEHCKCLLNFKYDGNAEAPVNFENTSDLSSIGAYATRGFCPEDCSGFKYYLLLIGVITTVLSTGEIAGTIVNLRAVDEEDKALSIGTLSLFTSFLGLIPGPIIMGALLDSTCLIWNETCGSKGNCWLYDSDKMTTALHTFPAVCIFVGSIGNMVVFYYSPRLNLYGEKDGKNNENMKDKPYEAALPVT